MIEREVEYTYQSILKVKKNESSWNYLRGLVNYHPEIKDSVVKK
jgi:hypothetical protein